MVVFGVVLAKGLRRKSGELDGPVGFGLQFGLKPPRNTPVCPHHPGIYTHSDRLCSIGMTGKGQSITGKHVQEMMTQISTHKRV